MYLLSLIDLLKTFVSYIMRMMPRQRRTDFLVIIKFCDVFLYVIFSDAYSHVVNTILALP
jgi:hypothetical protein